MEIYLRNKLVILVVTFCIIAAVLISHPTMANDDVTVKVKSNARPQKVTCDGGHTLETVHDVH